MIETTEVTPGVRAKGIERRFVMISYDITNSTLRVHIARKLAQHGFARINLSVWYGIYSEALLQEITSFVDMWRSKYGKQEDLVDIWVLTPMYFGDEATFVVDKYETAFREQWDNVDKTFFRISRILDIDRPFGSWAEEEVIVTDKNDNVVLDDNGNPRTEKKKVWKIDAKSFHSLYGDPNEEPIKTVEKAKKEGWIYHDKTDDTWVPYTGDQVMAIVKSVQYFIQDLRKSLASRRKYETDTATPEQITNFDVLDQRLERDDSYLKELSDRCAKRTVREIRKETGQTSIDQSENKGFTEQ